MVETSKWACVEDSIGDLLIPEDPEVHLQNRLAQPFSEHVSREEAGINSLVAPGQNYNSLTFSFSPHLSPTLPMSQIALSLSPINVPR